jgi:hypothetical protein
MNERKKIENLVRKKELETVRLEEEVKAAKSYIQALQDVLKLLPKVSENVVLRPGTDVARAREIILAKGRPVHVAEILEALGKQVTRENRASIASSLAAYDRKNEVFVRAAPNTFGLLELGHTGAIEGLEPPPDFDTPKESGSQPAATNSEDDDIPW